MLKRPARNLIAPFGINDAGFLEKCDKVSCFPCKLLQSFLPEMKITHQEPIAFGVTCINSKSFFKNAGFLEIGFFWKFTTSKSRFPFFCSARLFFKSQIVTD